MGCKLGKKCFCDRKTSPTCTNWSPSTGSKYYYCSQYLSSRVTCPLPRSSCPTCPLYINSTFNAREPTIEWDDPGQRNEYHREYMRQWRAKQRVKQRKEREGGS